MFPVKSTNSVVSIEYGASWNARHDQHCQNLVDTELVSPASPKHPPPRTSWQLGETQKCRSCSSSGESLCIPDIGKSACSSCPVSGIKELLDQNSINLVTSVHSTMVMITDNRVTRDTGHWETGSKSSSARPTPQLGQVILMIVDPGILGVLETRNRR